jgi:hypothetical protein
MEALFSSGRVVDVALCVMALEILAVGLLRRSGAAAREVAAAVLPGALLLLALRAALVGGPWTSVAAWLSAALVAHVFDLRRRLGARRTH